MSSKNLSRDLLRPLAAALLACLGSAAQAWIYPEHRDLSVVAVQRLDADRKAAFDRLWSQARPGDEARLCAPGADAGQGLAPACIDWAARAAQGRPGAHTGDGRGRGQPTRP